MRSGDRQSDGPGETITGGSAPPGTILYFYFERASLADDSVTFCRPIQEQESIGHLHQRPKAPTRFPASARSEVATRGGTPTHDLLCKRLSQLIIVHDCTFET